MDEILASIRRIMLEEQARLQARPTGDDTAIAAPRAAGPAPDAAAATPVIILDDSMAVPPPAPESPPKPAASSAERFSGLPISFDAPGFAFAEHAAYLPGGPAQPEPLAVTTIDLAAVRAPAAAPVEPEDALTGLTQKQVEDLLAPAVAAAASSQMETLLRRLEAERQAAAGSRATLEDVVRAELRPMLKSWLDQHLADIVEQAVKAEIARLTLRHTA